MKKHMTIGIEAERANSKVKTGVEHYAKQLILQFAELDTTNRYILYLRSEPEEWIKQLPANFSYKVMPFPIFWTQLRLSWEMWRRAPDVLFIPASSMPLFRPKKTVVTVHDEAFMFYPETYTAFSRYFHMFCDVAVSVLADRIIAVSESTKKDFMRFWKVSDARITVIHHGYTPMSKASVENNTTGALEKLPEKYVLFLSTLQPRKNLSRLISAFRLYTNEHADIPYKLVVVGKPGWKSNSIVQDIENNKDIVIYLDYVTDKERVTVYRNASALCMPSLYEGFGMWILEAFEMRVPVITSNISSMPEVGGNAAEYCDPQDVESIKKSLERVLLNKERAEQLVALGSERLKGFSWRACAEQTLKVILE